MIFDYEKAVKDRLARLKAEQKEADKAARKAQRALERAQKPKRIRSKEQQDRARASYIANKPSKVKRIVSGAKSRAKRKGLPFDITEEFLSSLIIKQNSKCALTGIPLDTESGKTAFSLSIDRIDPSDGYTQANVRIVCLMVNLALNEFGEEAFAKMCLSYIRNRGLSTS